MSLWGTQVSGSLPSELSRMKNLQVMLMYDTMLSGKIPNSFGDLTKLKVRFFTTCSVSFCTSQSLRND